MVCRRWRRPRMRRDEEDSVSGEWMLSRVLLTDFRRAPSGSTGMRIEEEVIHLWGDFSSWGN